MPEKSPFGQVRSVRIVLSQAAVFKHDGPEVEIPVASNVRFADHVEVMRLFPVKPRFGQVRSVRIDLTLTAVLPPSR